MSTSILILAAVIGYFLIVELTIAQIWVAALLGMLMVGLILVQYPKALLRFSEEVLKNKQKAWLPYLVFIIIDIWVLYAVLGNFF